MLNLLHAKGVCSAEEVAVLREEARAASAVLRDDETLTRVVEELTVHLQDSAPATGYKAGGGFHFTTADGNARMMLGGNLQTRFTSISPESGADSYSFNTPRVRLWASGHMLAPTVQYKVQLELAGPRVSTPTGGTSDAGFASLLDASVEWRPDAKFAVRMGQWEVFYSRQQIVGHANQEFVDRWMNLGTFAPSYQTGLMLHGGLGGAKDDFAHWSVNVLNGTGANRANTDDSLMGLARISVDPLGPMAKSEGDFSNGDLRLQAGLNAWTMGATAAGNIESVGADLTVSWQGFYLTSEFHRRDDPGATVQRGFFAQAGWFYEPGVADVGLRYGHFEDPGASAIRVTESLATLGWYPSGHNLKLQLDGGLVRRWPLSGFPADEWRLRLQLTLGF